MADAVPSQRLVQRVDDLVKLTFEYRLSNNITLGLAKSDPLVICWLISLTLKNDD